MGAVPSGASPYGCLDMAGNVWERTRSLWGEDLSGPMFKYPYDPGDVNREDLKAADTTRRVLRGGGGRQLCQEPALRRPLRGQFARRQLGR